MIGQYWFYSLSVILSALTCLVIAVVALQRRATPGSLQLMLLTLAVAIWAGSAAAIYASRGMLLKIVVAKVEYLGVVATPVLALHFVLEYTRQTSELSLIRRLALWVIPLLTIFLTWTNEAHQLVWTSFRVVNDFILIMEYGPWFWVFVGYAYLLLAISVFFLARAAWQAVGRYRFQLLAVFLMLCLPWLGNILTLFRPGLLPGLDLALIGVIPAGVIIAYSIFRFGLLDLVPIARHTLVEHMPEALLVLDAHDRVVDINPAAQSLIGKVTAQVIGEPVSAVLSEWSDLVERYGSASQIQEQIFSPGPPPAYFELRISPLYDRRHRYQGRLVVIRDVTTQKLNEAAARFSRQRWMEIVENVPQGILIVDQDGRIIFANGASEKLFGLERDEIVGRRHDAPEWHITEPEGELFSQEELPFHRVMSTGRTFYDVEYAVLGRDGRRLVLSVNAAPLHDAEGNIEAVLLVLEDITRRRLAQRIMARTAEELAIINRINLAISAGLDLNHVLRTLHQQCSQVVPSDVFYVALYDENSGIVELPLYFEGEYLTGLTFELQSYQGLTSHIISSRRTLYLPDTLDETQLRPALPIHTGGVPSRSYIGIPLLAHDKVIGVMSVQSYQPHAYTHDQIRLLESVAVQAAIAIENARLYGEVQRLAIVDELTGVYNYRGLLELGQREVERARRFSRPLVALFFDVNDFRAFNNQYSHAVGNLVLKRMTKVCRRHLRSVDIIARYGGDEFVILFPETDLVSAMPVAVRLCAKVAASKVTTAYGKLGVTISAGIAELSPEMPDLLALVDCANQAEHVAKEKGQGVAIYVDKDRILSISEIRQEYVIPSQ